MTRSSANQPESESDLVPFSILDTDLYKLTMQNAVFQLFHGSTSEYRFTNRSPDMLFSRKTFGWVQEQVTNLKTLSLTEEERQYLSQTCPYFQQSYLDYLENLTLHPDEQVQLEFVVKEKREDDSDDLGLIELGVKGLWRECILYEVPLMAILSEGYFLHTVPAEWTDDPTSTRNLAASKAYRLLSESSGNLVYSEFGTRRRRSYRVQKQVLEGSREGEEKYWKEVGGRQGKPGGLSGTSNVHFAMTFGMKPVGTIAHEWIMAVGAKQDYVSPNGTAMDMWEKVYPASATSPLHTMLTDTYTVDVFFREFLSDPSRASRWNALRHDSGDPVEFARQARRTWDEIARKRGEEEGKKGRVIFSDGLDVDEALKIWKECETIGINASFGIGTHLTNDFHTVDNPDAKSKPLNMVIKLRKMDGMDCVKLSDDRGKWTGDKAEVQRCRRILGLSDDEEDGGQDAPGMT